MAASRRSRVEAGMDDGLLADERIVPALPGNVATHDQLTLSRQVALACAAVRPSRLVSSSRHLPSSAYDTRTALRVIPRMQEAVPTKVDHYDVYLDFPIDTELSPSQLDLIILVDAMRTTAPVCLIGAPPGSTDPLLTRRIIHWTLLSVHRELLPAQARVATTTINLFTTVPHPGTLTPSGTSPSAIGRFATWLLESWFTTTPQDAPAKPS